MAGSAEDPVVTKSYVDEQIRRYLGNLNGLNGNKTAPSNPGDDIKNGGTSKEDQVTPETQVTIIRLEPGQLLFGGAGAEFVVRTGKAVAFTTDENGIVDVTAGKDIQGGAAIEINHLLLFPRDGRGIKPDPGQKTDIFVMVKGNYLLVNEDGSTAAP
jgi:hypothetical protein